MIVEIGSPEWYYERFPGFYNNRCYEILAEWHNGVPKENPEILPSQMFLGNVPVEMLQPTRDVLPTLSENKKKRSTGRKRKCQL